MAFGARNDDGWRLCLRKGKTVKHFSQKLYPGVEIRFTSQAKAKACADKLNEFHWKEYKKLDEDTVPESALYWGMLDTIAEFGGIDPAQVEVIRNDA